MIFKLRKKSLANLQGVNPELVQFIKSLEGRMCPVDFCITEGLRTKERQKELFDAGKSKTMNSKHLTGNAIDICIILPRCRNVWDKKEFPERKKCIDWIKGEAIRQNVITKLRFGADWGRDWPHIEML